jgi:hypothetical protein
VLTWLILARVTEARVAALLGAIAARLVIVFNAVPSVSDESDCPPCGSRFRGQDHAAGLSTAIT